VSGAISFGDENLSTTGTLAVTGDATLSSVLKFDAATYGRIYHTSAGVGHLDLNADGSVTMGTGQLAVTNGIILSGSALNNGVTIDGANSQIVLASVASPGPISEILADDSALFFGSSEGAFKLYGQSGATIQLTLSPSTGGGGILSYDSGTLTLTFNRDLTVNGNLSVDTDVLIQGGSITDNSGAISFGDENLSTSGNIAIAYDSYLYFDAAQDCYIYATETPEESVIIGVNSAEAYHFHENTLHGHDVNLQFVGEELIVDTGIDDSNDWTDDSSGTGTAVFGVSNCVLTAGGAGTNWARITADVTEAVQAGRDYSYKVVVSAYSVFSAPQINVGGTVFFIPGTGTFTGTITASTAAAPYIQVSPSPTSGSTITVEDFEVRLKPTNDSLMGDTIVYGDIDIRGDLLANTPTFKQVTIAQPNVFGSSVQNGLDVTCGTAVGGVSTLGGGVSMVCGDGGSILAGVSNAGDGGPVYIETGGGGTGLGGSNDGSGGNFTIRLGDRGWC
jgi:hypothetical protein